MSTRQNRKHTKQNILMSAFYDYVGEHYIDNICADIDGLKDEIDMTEVPETLDDWFEQYVKNIRKEETQKRAMRKVRNISSRVAVILLVLFIPLITLTLSVEAFRLQVYNLFFTDYNEYSSVKIKQAPTENVTIEWKNYYFPKFIPEGFYVESINENTNIKTIIFKNKNNEKMTLTQSLNGTGFSLNTEEGLKKEVVVKNRKAILVQQDGMNILFWNNEEFSFCLFSTLEVEVLIIVAESLEKK